MKICSKCGTEKERTEYYPHSKTKDKLRADCKKCTYKAVRIRVEQNPEKYKPPKRNSWLMRKYGLSNEDYEKMLYLHASSCGICGSKDPKGKRKYFCIDHNHETGKIRGLLCQHCNTALGCFQDKQDVLQKAINYLRLYE